MRVLSVTVGGFRNVAETTMELSGIMALVAPSNYGKSNLLDAIAFAIRFISESPVARSAMMGSVGDMPLMSALAGEDFRFKVVLEDPDLGTYRFVRYGFSFVWRRSDGSGQSIIDETIEVRSHLDGGSVSYLSRHQGEGKYRRSHGARTLRTIRLEGNQLAIGLLPAIDPAIEIKAQIKRIKEVGVVLCPSIGDSQSRGLKLLELKDGFCGGAMVGLGDKDLPKALYGLKVNHMKRFDELLVALHSLFPEFEDIVVERYDLSREGCDTHEGKSYGLVGLVGGGRVPYRVRDELYRMSVRSSSFIQPMDVTMMSVGARRMMRLLTTVAVAEAYGVGLVAIEDLEASVHPAVYGRLLELLDEGIENTSFIITTHSPLLIQYLKPRKVYVGLPSEDGVARFGRIREDKVGTLLAYARDRGLGFAECLFELMSSEGDDQTLLSRDLEA